MWKGLDAVVRIELIPVKLLVSGLSTFSRKAIRHKFARNLVALTTKSHRKSSGTTESRIAF